MRSNRFLLITVVTLSFTAALLGQGDTGSRGAVPAADLDAVTRLLTKYRQTEEQSDLLAQGRLMATDRVWVSQFASGRRTDNVENMKIQQAQADRRKIVAAGMQQYIEDRERIVKFYADGKMAIASFYRYVTRVFTPETSADARTEYAPNNELMTVVMEKRGSEWVIVHTHVSAIGLKN